MTADVDHCNVDEPHGEGEKNLGVAEVGGAHRGLGDERANEQAGRHAGEAEEKRLEGDLVNCFQRRKPGARGEFLFQAPLLNEIEQRGDERDDECGIGGEKESDMEEDPAGVDGGECSVFLAWVEGGDEAEEERDGQKEDAEGDGSVTAVDEEEGGGENETEEGKGLMGVDGETMVSGVEHLGEGDEVKEDGGGSGGDGDVPPAGAIVECGGKHGERGYAVEEDRDSEPEERHGKGSPE